MILIYNIYNLIINKIHNLIVNKFYDDCKFIKHWSGSSLIDNNNDNYLISRTDTGSSEYKLIIRVLENNMSKHVYMRNTTDTYIFKIKDVSIGLVNIELSDNTSLVFKLSHKLKTELIREIKVLASRKLITVASDDSISNINKKSTFKSISSLSILGNDINQYSILYDELPDDSYTPTSNTNTKGYTVGELSLTPSVNFNQTYMTASVDLENKERVKIIKEIDKETKYIPVYVGPNNSFNRIIELFSSALDGLYSSYRKDETIKTIGGYQLSKRITFIMKEGITDVSGSKINYIEFKLDPNSIRIKIHYPYNIVSISTGIKFGISSIVMGYMPPDEIGLIVAKELNVEMIKTHLSMQS